MIHEAEQARLEKEERRKLKAPYVSPCREGGLRPPTGLSEVGFIVNTVTQYEPPWYKRTLVVPEWLGWVMIGSLMLRMIGWFL